MRFATLALNDGREQVAIGLEGRWIPLDHVDESLDGDMLCLINREFDREQLDDLGRRAQSMASSRWILGANAEFAPPYRRPRLIWGIGLNYAEHASDLSEKQPQDPASFVKGDHTVIGHHDEIMLPPQSARVTTEAEIGLIIGRRSRAGTDAVTLETVFGFVPILDQTAEDILEQNPRFLTRSKNFATFFAFGPEVLTLDSLPDDLGALTVSTVINGQVVRSNRVDNMLHSPSDLLRFHTDMMPMFPGDIISTGTPGAGVIVDGDTAAASIDGFESLTVSVRGAEARQ